MIREGGYYTHKTLGVVHFVVRANARRVVARWNNGVLNVSIPPIPSLSLLDDYLNRMEQRLLAIKPATKSLSAGMRYEFPDFAVTLKVLPGRKRDISVFRRVGSEYDVVLSDRLDLKSNSVASAVEKAVVAVARRLAPDLLLPRASELAARHGLKVSRWQVSTGRKLLGRCSSKRVISLSAVLVLLPVELRDYVICHELAHLTEMNHSEAFHELCNYYCGGQEKALERALKARMKKLRETLFV